MSRNDLRTVSRRIKNTVNEEAQPRVRQAFLVDSYFGYAREVLIQIGDPALGRGTITRATIQPGSGTTVISAGAAVSVICRHGRYEIIGLRTS
jgi:hypothetical protein